MQADEVVVSRPTRHYAWVVAGVTFLVLLFAAGFRSAPGVLIVPLHEEEGWSRSIVSAAVSVNLLFFGFAGPFAAALMARFGLRRVVMVALFAIGCGALATAAMTAPWQLILLWGVVVGAGSGCMATVLAATVANRWFVERRGIVVGALTAATATGQLVFLPVLGYLADHVGWRWVSVVVASGAFLGLPLVARFMRDSPEEMGLTPYGAPDDYEPPAPVGNPVALAVNGLQRASRMPAFWLLATSFFVCGASTNGLIGTHFIAAGHDHGMSETSAAGLLALVGVFDIIGTIGSGWLTDRVDPRRLLLAYYGLRGLSLLFLDSVLDARGVGVLGFVLFYGLDWVATVPPTVALCSRYFGPVHGGVVYGWVFASHQVGAAIAALAAGAIRNSTGSYQLAFQGAALLCIAAALWVQALRREGEVVEPEPALAPS
jgi:MFS family permease